MPATRTRQYSLEDISPYYVPDAPPPVLPILIAQTEIGKLRSTKKLLAQEEINAQTFYDHSYGLGQVKPSPNASDDDPVISSPSNSITPDCSGTSKIPSKENPALPASNTEEALIPKPEGEAGRPGRGGYSLESQVRWGKAQKEEIRVRFPGRALQFSTDLWLQLYTSKVISEQLDPSICYKSQSPESVQAVVKLVPDPMTLLSKLSS